MSQSQHTLLEVLHDPYIPFKKHKFDRISISLPYRRTTLPSAINSSFKYIPRDKILSAEISSEARICIVYRIEQISS